MANDDEDGPKKPGKKAKPSIKTGSGDIDRFLQELDKLRRKANESGATNPPVVKPVGSKIKKPIPTVSPVRKAKPVPQKIPSVTPKVDRLPPALVLPTDAPQPKLAQLPQHHIPPMPGSLVGSNAISRSTQPKPKGPFGEALLALISTPGSLPAAVVLQEIFGPPKCKQNRRRG